MTQHYRYTLEFLTEFVIIRALFQQPGKYTETGRVTRQ
jgi:hypothetical protein